MAEASGAQTHVPPIKLLGARRALASLGYGAVLGIVVGFAVSAIVWPVASTQSLRTGLIVMSLFLGLFFGPPLTLLFVSVKVTALAQEMAKRTGRPAIEHFPECLSSADFAAAGWVKLVMFSILGLAVGIGVGFLVGTTYVKILPAGDAVIFLFALLGGVVGVLTALSVLVGREAKRRCNFFENEMTPTPQLSPVPIIATSPVASWCKAVLGLDIAVLAIAGIASLPGFFTMFRAPSALMLVAGILVWSKVIVGLLADTGLLRGNRGRSLSLAYVAAAISFLGGLFNLGFVDPSVGPDPGSLAYKHASGLQVFLVLWTVGWNVLYLAAARATARVINSGAK